MNAYLEEIKEAAELGKIAGTSAGSWVIDGNTSEDECRRIFRGIEDCDPMVMDMLPCNESGPLSGEFADNPTPQSLMNELGLDIIDALEYDVISEFVCDAYENAWYDAMQDEVIRACKYQLEEG